MSARASWMFDDNPEGSLFDVGQRFWTSWTRAVVVLAYRPARPFLRWISSKTASK